jgi:hypothetical protein
MFSSFVRRAGPTRFFARRIEDRQFLACELTYASDGLTSMVIPVPVPNQGRDRAVRAIDLATYRNFFDHLDRAFPRDSVPAKAKTVPVLQCVPHAGSLDYWPSLAEYHASTSHQCALSPEIWNNLPHYKDWGLVSVILPDTSDVLSRVFPIAFEFKTRMKEGNYFPTLEVIDCRANTATTFHHELYYQGKRRQLSDCPSVHSLEESMDYNRSRPLLVDGHSFKRNLVGKFPNGDVII